MDRYTFFLKYQPSVLIVFHEATTFKESAIFDSAGYAAIATWTLGTFNIQILVGV